MRGNTTLEDAGIFLRGEEGVKRQKVARPEYGKFMVTEKGVSKKG